MGISSRPVPETKNRGSPTAIKSRWHRQARDTYVPFRSSETLRMEGMLACQSRPRDAHGPRKTAIEALARVSVLGPASVRHESNCAEGLIELPSN
jgi:hypothetical protein